MLSQRQGLPGVVSSAAVVDRTSQDNSPQRAVSLRDGQLRGGRWRGDLRVWSTLGHRPAPRARPARARPPRGALPTTPARLPGDHGARRSRPGARRPVGSSARDRRGLPPGLVAVLQTLVEPASPGTQGRTAPRVGAPGAAGRPVTGRPRQVRAAAAGSPGGGQTTGTGPRRVGRHQPADVPPRLVPPYGDRGALVGTRVAAQPTSGRWDLS